jgi:hypothetical protein
VVASGIGLIPHRHCYVGSAASDLFGVNTFHTEGSEALPSGHWTDQIQDWNRWLKSVGSARITSWAGSLSVGAKGRKEVILLKNSVLGQA